jgi:hypothetical protein
MNPKTIRRSALLAIFILSAYISFGQIATEELTGANLNTINTAIPFITIAPEARSGGMGDVGAASLPDVNSQHWNAAKYAFIEGKGGVSASFTPWLRVIIPDIKLGYLSAYYKIGDKNVISTSMRFFSLGSIAFTNIHGVSWGQYTPFEMTFDAGYSRKLSDHLSVSVVARYIHSDLTSGKLISGEESSPGTSLAGDLGIYYQNDLYHGEYGCNYAFGLNLTNVGTPISYTADAVKVPIPTNLRIGSRITFPFLEHHSLSFMLDANKLLVPTPPHMVLDPMTNEYHVLHGYGEPETIIHGMIQSFYDAPGYLLPDGTGSAFLEELHEIMISVGAEYKFSDMLSIRTGYFHEHETKGNRKYLTIGIGAGWNAINIDASYLIPVNGEKSPLAHTIRLTLSYEI